MTADEMTETLDLYQASILREMAQAAGLDVTDNLGKNLPKAALVQKMRSEFFTAERVQASWARLDERERAVVNRLLLHDGRVNTKSFLRELARAKLVITAEKPDVYYRNVPYATGYIGDPHQPRSRVFEDMIARLTYHGIVFSTTTALSSGGTPYKMRFHPGTTLYVPTVVRRHLPEPVPVAQAAQDWQPARVVTGDPTVLLRDLYLYWDFVRRNEVTLLKSGLVGKRWLKALNQILLVPDAQLENIRREDEAARPYLLRRLLESLKLIRTNKSVVRPNHSDPLHIPEFWSQPVVEQLRACLDAWRRLGDGIRLGTDVEKYGPRYSHAVQMVLNALEGLRTDYWYEPEDLVERIQIRDADFLFPERTRVENFSGSWYYGYTGGYFYGHPKQLLETFERKEIEFVRRCVGEVLFPFGMVELGYGSENTEEWLAWRLTPTGKAISKNAASIPDVQAPAGGGKLIIQPNFQLMAIGPVSLAMLAQLDLFAECESADRGAFQYRLSRESIYRAQQMGLDVSDVLRFLAQASEVDVPQNVSRSLQEWAEQHERIVFRSGVSLLQAAADDLLDELMNRSPVGKHLVRLVTPTVALVRRKHQPQLIGALIEQGLFPAVSGAEPASADQSVTIQEDGTIQSVHAVPSLHLRGRLDRLAEDLGDGQWKLTPASVGRAGGSKNKVLSILEELNRLQRGPLPETLAVQIRAWGGYYGHASADTLTLIEFRDVSTLEELRAIPELHDWLTPFAAGNRALAVVPQDQLAHLEEVLSRYGVNVRRGLK